MGVGVRDVEVDRASLIGEVERLFGRHQANGHQAGAKDARVVVVARFAKLAVADDDVV